MMASLTDNNLGTQPVCQNCTTSTTPLWRRDENGSVLCNACGLFLKLHGSPRPISLKTDVIKSRNRVKTSGPPQKKKSLFDANGLPASQSTPSSQVQYSQQQQPNGQVHSTNGSDSPTSRTQTPTLHHPSNIAPQHLFDGISQSTDQVFHSNFPNSTYPRQPSPGSNSSDRHLGPPPTYEDMLRDNTQMKTRISELEVINDLYRGTVSQYEQGSAPQAEMVPKEADVDAENGLATALLQSQRREEELKRKVERLETQMAELKAELEGRERKKARVEDVGEYPEPPNGLHEP